MCVSWFPKSEGQDIVKGQQWPHCDLNTPHMQLSLRLEVFQGETAAGGGWEGP